jgi:hypothetical protein
MTYDACSIAALLAAAKKFCSAPDVLSRVELVASSPLPNYNDVVDLMQRIEGLAESDSLTAFRLMIALWSIASDAMAHDVCDGIDLWVTQAATDITTRTALLDFSNSFNNSSVRSHFARLLGTSVPTD